MIDVLLNMMLVLAGFILLPILVYVCSKMATVGYLKGRKMFEDLEDQEKNDEKRTRA